MCPQPVASRRRPSSSLLHGAGTLLAFWGRGWGLPGLQPSVAALQGASCTPCCRLEWDFWAMAPLLSRDVPCCPLELTPRGLAAGGSGVMTAACPGCARCERAEPRSTVWSSRSPLLVRWPWPGCASALCSSAQRHRLQLVKHGPGAVRGAQGQAVGLGWGPRGHLASVFVLEPPGKQRCPVLCSAPALQAQGCPGGTRGVPRSRNIPGSRRGSWSQLRGAGGATVAMFVVGKWWLLSRGTSQLKRRDLHLIWAQGWGRNWGTWDRREPLASGHAAPSAGTSGGSRFPASCVCAVNK